MPATDSPTPVDQQRRLLLQLVRFSHHLRSHGIATDPSRMIDLCRCIPLVDLQCEEDLFAACRASLLTRREDVALFERLYRQFWYQQYPRDDQTETGNGEAASPPQESTGQTRQLATSRARQPDGPQQRLSYSQDAILMHKDLGSMTAGELERARYLIAELISLIANTRSRRRKRAKRGNRVNFQRMLRHTASRGADTVMLEFWKRKIRKTRLILLCDVSGSMEHYGRFLIQFIYGVYQDLTRIDVAVFSTRMTVITEHLAYTSMDTSLQEVSEAVQDWAGGTDIGTCLQEFNHRFSQQMAGSRTFVIILSDGWDRGDSRQMRKEMACLSRNAECILWMNPLLGNSSYRPLTKGIQAALPYIDYFLPAHNLESFARLIQQLRAIL